MDMVASQGLGVPVWRGWGGEAEARVALGLSLSAPALLLLGLAGSRAVASRLGGTGEAAMALRYMPLALLTPCDLLCAELQPLCLLERDHPLWLCTLLWRTPLPCAPAPRELLARWCVAKLEGGDAGRRAGRVAAAALALLDADTRADAQLARRLCVGLRQLERDFRRCLGLPLSDCGRRLRVQCAAARVLGGAPLAEAAACCGFADQPHMTRAFRRIAGVTPGALRARWPGPPAEAGPRRASGPAVPQPGGSGRGRPCSSTAT